jgi:UDP-2,3-diacylglucosamine pyrophosphatase LpxH
MLAVISDLHFEEVGSDRVDGPAGGAFEFLERNFSPAAFEVLFHELAASARHNEAKGLDLVLAGDIFDLHRTTKWFDDELRPYLANTAIAEGSPLEAKVIAILDAIASERSVAGSLSAIRRLSAQDRDESFFVSLPPGFSIRVHYLPGNHDRLANATPSIRARVRHHLGLAGGDAPFPHVFDCEDPRVLVRHGHEYDPMNFGGALPSVAPIPARFAESAYDDWTFGDFITIEVAMGLPHAFRAVHGDAAIAADVQKATVYERLLEFDDLRPQSQLVPFLLTIPGRDAASVWASLEPAVRALLERIADSPHFRAALRKGRVPLVWRWLLGTRFWRLGLPLWLVRWLGGFAASADSSDPSIAAKREQQITEGNRRFVIAGHTHRPQVALLSTRDRFDRYFVDTGTWRNVVFSTPSGAFSNAKAMTYVVVYSSEEDATGRHRGESFDYWSGYTRRW